jgi:hypothetical protein
LNQPHAKLTTALNFHNFSGGPGAIPEVGISVHGISHRSDWFRAVLDEAEIRVRGGLARFVSAGWGNFAIRSHTARSGA